MRMALLAMVIGVEFSNNNHNNNNNTVYIYISTLTRNKKNNLVSTENL